MADDQRVQLLLEEILETGRSAEEVCRVSPELLPQVREGWRKFRRLKAQIGDLFPETASSQDRETGSSWDPTADLPQIPGYEIQALLGQGGMGAVFRVRHLRLNRLVALKMMLAGSYASRDERSRFQREAEAVAGLQHPNVVQIHDVGESDGRSYFTMEFLGGGSLAQQLAGIPQPGRWSAELLAKLTGAVEVAHRGGIVHRDLKPSNVLLTTDGIPKISDFGLARRLDENAGLTRSGLVVGTPSYMAPEQARGDTMAVGLAVDVYALGAILYELLTGRPPFRAETAAETVRQVLDQDPVPPSKFNARVPRDLETICLKCLQKEPIRRYDGAAALAEDLRRFLRGEAIAARPEGRLGRMSRRVRRRPAFWAAIAGGALVMAILAGGGVWLLADRAEIERAAEARRLATERAAEDDLRDMVKCQEKSSWPAAHAALERAKGKLGDGGPIDLRRRLEQGARDLDLVDRLDAIRMMRVGSLGGRLVVERSHDEFLRAFKDAGLGDVGDAPEVVADRVRASGIRKTLVAMLDDYTLYPQDQARRDWLTSVARLADDDPTGWRNRIRDPKAIRSREDIVKILENAPIADQPVPFLLAITTVPSITSEEVIAFRKRIQQAHPDDFWANLFLASILKRSGESEQSIRYYQAALALRPGAGMIHNDLGTALGNSGRHEEAIWSYRQALRIDPTAPQGHYNLARALYAQGRYDEAIDEDRIAARLAPGVPLIHRTLGVHLEARGRPEEAIAAYRRAVALDPEHGETRKKLRGLLIRMGRAEEARLAWKAALSVRPPAHDDWYGFAEFCLFLGQEDEYRQARLALLDSFGAVSDPYLAERTGRACLLRPATEAELRRIVAVAERSWTMDRSKDPGVYPHFLFVQGLAEYRQGRFDGAIALMQGEASHVLGPAPGLVLALALNASGRVVEARNTLAKTVLSYDWRAAKVRDQDEWIYHSLRREAETLMVPNLPEFLAGKYQPRDMWERFALMGACQFANRQDLTAGLYADAFAETPQIADDLRSGHRYNAARAAAMAGRGGGALLGEEEQTRWRGQARTWLRADLAGWDKALSNDPAQFHDPAREVLKKWQGESDLSGLRDQAELIKLSVDERDDCLSLWNEARTLLDRVEHVK